MSKIRSASGRSHEARVVSFTGGGLHATYMAKCRCGWRKDAGRDSVAANLAASLHNQRNH